MPNPILEMLNAPKINPNVAQAFKALRNSNNPQQAFENLMHSNPQLQQVMNMVQSSNMSPKDLFYSMAKQKGVNPDQILNMLNQ